MNNNLTSHESVNKFVAELHMRMYAVLGDELMGLYLDGSLALGDFDEHSDIDFVAVTRRAIPEQTFAQLQTMHEQLAQLNSPWAVQHEGSYLSMRELRRHDPESCTYPNIERGVGERLKWARHDETWNVHRHVLRERGIVVTGPAPRDLVDPIDFDALRTHMRRCMIDWPGSLIDDDQPIGHRGYQSYIVLTLCRMLCTVELGEIRSKPAAAQWAKSMLGEPWAALIEHAWIGRSNGGEPADPVYVVRTKSFVRFALARL